MKVAFKKNDAGEAADSANVGIGTTSPEAKLNIRMGSSVSLSSGSNDNIYIKNTTSRSNYDPNIYNVDPADIGIMINHDSSTTSGPDKVGMVLHNGDATKGGFSPMLLFSKKESGSSPFNAAIAGIYARSPNGTAANGGWIDGELIFATAGDGISNSEYGIVNAW